MEEDDDLHIVVFPWLAFGHMLPFLELSKSLARRGHHITFLSTPRNIQRLPKLPPDLSHLIHFHSFPLPPIDGLPPSAEATTDVPHDDIPFLKIAFDGLAAPFSEFITNTHPKPDAIIHDFSHHWIPKIAAEIHVPCVLFNTTPAVVVSFFGPMSGDVVQVRRTLEDFTVSPPWVAFESKVAYRAYEARKLFESIKHHEEAGSSEGVRFVTTVQGCSFMVLRSCMELEGEWLSLLRDIYNKPVIPIGLLPPDATEFGENDETGVEVEIAEWLDKQISKSVVYIAFGTEVAVNTELLHEVAYGLELVKLPFVWVLRSSNNLDLLPKGFEDRTKGYGIVITGWAPQLKVLSHDAVGGFMTHCGWSSIIEGLQFGHPLVLFPIFGDQGLNARMIEEKGFGVEVERNEDDGSSTREDVAKAIRLVMVDEKGELCRKKAKEMSVVIANKDCHDKYVDDFLKFLKSYSNQRA